MPTKPETGKDAVIQFIEGLAEAKGCSPTEAEMYLAELINNETVKQLAERFYGLFGGKISRKEAKKLAHDLKTMQAGNPPLPRSYEVALDEELADFVDKAAEDYTDEGGPEGIIRACVLIASELVRKIGGDQRAPSKKMEVQAGLHSVMRELVDIEDVGDEDDEAGEPTVYVVGLYESLGYQLEQTASVLNVAPERLVRGYVNFCIGFRDHCEAAVEEEDATFEHLGLANIPEFMRPRNLDW